MLRALAVALLAAGLLAACTTPAGGHPADTQPAPPSVTGNPGMPGRPSPPATPGQPPNGLTPGQIRSAYDVTPLIRAGITGAGQTIVVVDSFGSPTIAPDLAYFDRFFGLPAPPSLRVIQPAGRVPAFKPGNSNRVGWAQEATLDVEWAHVMAPGASIVVVETPTSENEGTTGFPQIVAAETYALKHHLGQVITQSFAATEQTFPSTASIMSFRSAFKLAQREHVTIVSATGDDGATDYEYNMKDLYTRPVVSWPATDPLVTAVGGTQLNLTADGGRRSPDVAWPGSGGGESVAFARPAYQNSVQSVTGDARGVPDISMDASCRSSVAMYASFYAGGPHWDTECGTSLSAPLFAGIVALADQYAGHGKPHGLGLINPAIYEIAARRDPGIVDVVSGSNNQEFSQHGTSYTVHGYSARPGYDLVTGTGTVDAAAFVPELAKLAG